MPLTLDNLEPAAAKPGDRITLTGTGFSAGAAVSYQGTGVQYVDTRASVASETEISSIVPDLFLGVAGLLTVKVLLGEESSNELPLSVEAHPAVEEPYPLCSLGQVKQFLGITANETLNDTKLAFLIKVASGQIAGETRIDFRVQTYTSERYDGDGSNLLELRHTPIAEVTTLSIDGQAAPVDEVKVYENYLKFDEGMEYSARLRSRSRVFPLGSQNILVSYKAGHLAMPADISHACVIQVLYLMNLGNKQGVVSEANPTAGVTTTYAQAPLAPEARRVCNRYRRAKVRTI